MIFNDPRFDKELDDMQMEADLLATGDFDIKIYLDLDIIVVMCETTWCEGMELDTGEHTYFFNPWFE